MKDIEEKVEKKKSHGFLITILVVLLMAACVGGGYLLGATNIINSKEKAKQTDVEEKEPEEKKESKTTEYDVNDEKVANLIDNLVSGANCYIFENEYATDHKVVAADVSNQRAYYIASRVFFKSRKASISLDEFVEEIQSKLGKDYTFDPTSINYNDVECPTYLYNEDKESFDIVETACGGTCGPMTSYKLYKAVDVDGVLTLDVKVLFAKDAYYSDYDKTNKVCDVEDELDSYYDQGASYKFTFKNENDNYVFVSAEPVN